MISEDEFRVLLRSAGGRMEDRDLTGLADQALRRARRRTLRTRLAGGAVAATVLAAGGVIAASWPTGGPPIQPASTGAGTVRLAQGLGLYPVLSQHRGPCATSAGPSEVLRPEFTYKSADTGETTCYHVDLAKGLSLTSIQSAKAVRHQGFWTLQIQLDAEDTPTLGELTRVTTGQSLAITTGDRAIAATTINAAVTSGQFEIPAGPTQDTANTLIHQLTGQ